MIRVPSRTVTGGGRRRALRLSRIIIASALVTVAYLPATTGAAKPAYQAYKLPIWVSGKGADVTVYGQVRPAENGTAQTVDLQVASGAGAAFKTVQSVPVTTANGVRWSLVANRAEPSRSWWQTPSVMTISPSRALNVPRPKPTSELWAAAAPVRRSVMVNADISVRAV